MARAARDVPFEAGALFQGKYRILGRLGEGGMGAVWAARNIATGARVALKVVTTTSPDAPRRLRQEGQVGATLSHRHIARTFDMLEENGDVVLVMELLKGQSLSDYLFSGKRVPPEAAALLGAAVLSALQHAHDQGVVHRDLSASNIFLSVDPDGTLVPKIVDFGVARREGSPVRTAAGEILGTPQYLAPERIRGRGDGPASDIFSVAVLLYEAMTGATPFAAPTSTAIVAAVLEREVEPHDAIPPRLWFVLRRALSKEPASRPTSAAQFARELLSAMDMTEGRSIVLEGLAASDAGDVEASLSPTAVAVWGRRRRLQWLVAAVLVFTGAAALLWTVVAHRGSVPLDSSATAAPRLVDPLSPSPPAAPVPATPAPEAAQAREPAPQEVAKGSKDGAKAPLRDPAKSTTSAPAPRRRAPSPGDTLSGPRYGDVGRTPGF